MSNNALFKTFTLKLNKNTKKTSKTTKFDHK